MQELKKKNGKSRNHPKWISFQELSCRRHIQMTLAKAATHDPTILVTNDQWPYSSFVKKFDFGNEISDFSCVAGMKICKHFSVD